MKIKGIILLLGGALLFSFIGCGSTTDIQKKDEMQKSTKSNSELNEDNYVDLAKYYYAQSFMTRGRVTNSKVIQQSKISRDKSRDKNSFYIKLNKSSDNNKTESMIIRKGDRLVSVEIGNESVKVSLHGTTKVTRQTLSLDAFINLNTQEH